MTCLLVRDVAVIFLNYSQLKREKCHSSAITSCQNLQNLQNPSFQIKVQEKKIQKYYNSIMDSVKNAAKSATGSDSQFKSGMTFVTTQDLAAHID